MLFIYDALGTFFGSMGGSVNLQVDDVTGASGTLKLPSVPAPATTAKVLTSNLLLANSDTVVLTGGAATSTNNIMTVTDGPGNSGTGSLLSVNTALGSAAAPIAAGAHGNTYLSMDSGGHTAITGQASDTGTLLSIGTAAGSAQTPFTVQVAGSPFRAIQAASNGNVGLGINNADVPGLQATLGPNGATGTVMHGLLAPTGNPHTSGGTLPDATYVFVTCASDNASGTTCSRSSPESAGIPVSGGGGNGKITVILVPAEAPGAQSCRLYFSTTSGGETNYFLISPCVSPYPFTTTSGAIVGTGPPTTSTAYVNEINGGGVSWFLAGNLGLGTSNPTSLFHVAGDVSLTQVLGNGPTVSITPGSGAGSGSASVTGTDLAGTITVVPAGSPTAAATIATITFSPVYSSAPHCVLSPTNASAAMLGVGVGIYQATTSSTLVLRDAGATALSTGPTYIWNYLCAQ